MWTFPYTISHAPLQLLAELENSIDSRQIESAAGMLAALIQSAPSTAQIYVTNIVKVLKRRITDPSPQVVVAILQVLGNLATAVGPPMMEFIDFFCPIVIDILNDRYWAHGWIQSRLFGPQTGRRKVVVGTGCCHPSGTQDEAAQPNAQHHPAHHTTPHNTTQHNTTQHNTTQHNTTQHNTTQHNTTQHNTTQHNTTQHNTTQHNTTQHNTTQHNTTQHNTTQHNTTQHNTTQHNTTQHNTTQHNTTQHNTTQHNTTQHTTTHHTTPHRCPACGTPCTPGGPAA